MGSISDNSEWRRKRLDARRAKIIALGINPRSLKFQELLHRRVF